MAKASTRDFEEYGWRVGRPHLSAGPWEQFGSHRASIYRHPKGTVEIDEYRSGFTSMGVTMNGRHYRRRWEAKWGDKTLARLARQFIEDIMNEGQNG